MIMLPAAAAGSCLASLRSATAFLVFATPALLAFLNSGFRLFTFAAGPSIFHLALVLAAARAFLGLRRIVMAATCRVLFRRSMMAT